MIPHGIFFADGVASACWLFAVAAASSLIGGMLGMASGIFVVPVLTLFGHVDIRVAIGASIVSVIACSCGSAAPLLRKRLTHVRLAVVLECATVTGALCGVLLSGHLPARILYFLFAAVLFVSARQMLRRRVEHPGAESAHVQPGTLDATWIDPDTRREMAFRVHRLAPGMVLMYGAGLLSALLGIGSGVLKIPAMDTALRLPIKVSSATSNFMIGVTAATSAGAYFMHGDIVTWIAGPVALGSVPGALLGARLLVRVPNEKLRLLFVCVLLLLGASMLFESLGIPLAGVPV
ncbi:sulfite exporter TauE/SafE family protein [Paraburkholderia guartelaensis]|uniref:sulfite exporter TauE/SafE family protein n=1 Tax=Paraburkholderia guartelaensis TaxID=2546446 RepID=UPI002AB7DDDE|nr:sulfite exporter TauE/SafE family protein [Paraburkholderia guartelaensis]